MLSIQDMKILRLLIILEKQLYAIKTTSKLVWEPLAF